MPSFRDIDDLIHTWAQNNTGRGSCGNVSYDGPTLYSYSTPIGMFVGWRDVLISGGGSSVTTAAHIGKAAGAVSHRAIFRLPDGYGMERDTTPATVRAMWGRVIEAACVRYTEATRKPSKAKHLRELRAALESANALCTRFGLEPFPAAPTDAEADAYTAGRAAAALAQRAADKQARAERDASDRAEALADLDAWIAGTSDRLRSYHLIKAERGDCLRVSPYDPEIIETTSRASVPASHVRDRAPLLLRMVRSRRGWQRNGHTIHLGHYSVDRVDVDGTLHAGCHTFHRAELERFAAVLDVTEAPES